MKPYTNAPLRLGKRWMLVALLALLFWSDRLKPAELDAASRCLAATGETAVTACRQELQANPADSRIRFALSDALMGLKRYDDAVAVLREGLERFPGDEQIKTKLTFAESYMAEQRWIEKRQAANASPRPDTRIRLSLIRCTTLKGDAALTACNDGLAAAPGHPGLLTGRGNVWLGMDRNAEAIKDFQAALAADPANPDAADGLRVARTRRSVAVSQCLERDGADGLKACEAALMKDADDAFAIQKRRAQLLHTLDRTEEAVTAYRMAARLNPGDAEVRQALATLTAPIPSSAPGAAAAAAPETPAKSPKSPPPPSARPAAKPAPVPPPKPEAPAAPPVLATARTPSPVASLPNRTDMPAPATTPAVAAPPLLPESPAPPRPRQYTNLPELPGRPH